MMDVVSTRLKLAYQLENVRLTCRSPRHLGWFLVDWCPWSPAGGAPVDQPGWIPPQN